MSSADNPTSEPQDAGEDDPSNALPVSVKYPRTPHLLFSHPSKSDTRVSNNRLFIGKEVVVTEKLDGEGFTLLQDHRHARSLASVDHASRTYVKQLHASVRYSIPQGWRVCGESLQAQHSIHYNALPSYFLVFSVWDAAQQALSWDDTVAFCTERGLDTVPVLYRGLWDEDAVRSCFTGKSQFEGEQEGFVVRLAASFSHTDFARSVAKFVRPHHVTPTTEHWFRKPVTLNGLRAR